MIGQAPDIGVARSLAQLRAHVQDYRRAGERVALIPTMGALHEGHLALLEAGRRHAGRTVASIFVNPTQFSPKEDFALYPRDEAGDLAKLARAGADLVYLPAAARMYPEGFATSVTVSGVSEGLCGKFRPGHFGGVATVVTKLLLQAAPDVALFGEKDYQQLQVIRRLVRDLDLAVEIIGVPTIREADGLAMSSRNRYLSPEQRRKAAALPKTLRWIAAQMAQGQEAEPLLARGTAMLREAGFDPVQYLECVDAETLRPAVGAGRAQRLLAAAYQGQVRLIDNVEAPASRDPAAR